MINRFRFILAILTGKLAAAASRLLGNQGTNFPGQLARRIYPNILRELAANVRHESIIITGTNGKTTTSNLIASVLREDGKHLVHNQEGANMLTGITTAFIQASNWSGQRLFDYALLETDEANVPLLLEEVKAQFLVITNFFRDQLDRYGELDTTIGFISKAAQKHQVELILNADDPLSAAFTNKDLTLHFYGFAPTIYDHPHSQESREGRYCLLCGSELTYERFHYAQLGKYKCPGCGQHNPEPEFFAQDLRMEPLVEFEVGETKLHSQYQGFYNAYNLLAAFSISKILNIKDAAIQKALAAYRPQAGRMEQFNIGGKDCLLVLVKNPTGLNQSLTTFIGTAGKKDLFFALNDNAADGRDISWIWDAEVEMLEPKSQEIASMICSGQRSGDIAVRIKYAGLSADIIEIVPDLDRGVEAAIRGPGETTYILCTYTALFIARKAMISLQKQIPDGSLKRGLVREG